MSDIQAQKILYLSDHVDISLIKFIHDGPFTTIDLLRPSLDESDFYKKLKGMARRTRGFQVYFKNNLPEKYRNYHNNHRVSDFLLVAEIGFSISLERDDSVFLPLASHGYWPHEPSMKSFFLATGPLLLNFSMNKENSILKKSSKEIRNEFSNLDVYPFLNHLLGCTGLPGNYSDFLIRELIR